MRKRLIKQREASGNCIGIEQATGFLDPNMITLGLARRFATYKRPNLLLQNPERLSELLENKERPMRLIIAGKAHPQDESGKAMIKAWSDFIRKSNRTLSRYLFN